MEQPFTINRLKRWSCSSDRLPDIKDIRELHIYDFDNTIFQTPVPNKSLWDGYSVGKLMDIHTLAEGGWWHHPAILAATGAGLDIEESRAWEGHWNEHIVDLIRMSMAQKDAMTILLTGRAEGPFSDLVQRMCKSKKLKFDMYGLKPLIGPSGQPFGSTMKFKQEFLTTLIRTYMFAQELRMYEDRPHHVKEFRAFFERFNDDMRSQSISRGTIEAAVVEVTDVSRTLDPVAEAVAVQTLVNAHNNTVRTQEASGPFHPLMIKKNGIYAAYKVASVEDSNNLLNLVALPQGAKKLANAVLITTYAAESSSLQKAGGLGKVVRFEVAAIGFIPDRIWAAEVRGIGTQPFTHLRKLQIVLALNDGARPSEARNIRQWHPIPKNESIQFDTVVSEVYRLSLEEETLPTSLAGPTHGASIVPQKRRADHNPAEQNHNHNHRGNGARGRSQRGRSDFRGHARKGQGQQQNARGGFMARGGATPRGTNNARGRGGRGIPHASNRRVGYKDHDAAGGAKPEIERNMHNDY